MTPPSRFTRSAPGPSGRDGDRGDDQHRAALVAVATLAARKLRELGSGG